MLVLGRRRFRVGSGSERGDRWARTMHLCRKRQRRQTHNAALHMLLQLHTESLLYILVQGLL